MKVSVIYATITGHSRKIADAIAKELNVEALNIKTNPQLKNIDLLYIISGIYGAKSSPELLEYIKSITKEQVKKVALVTSSGGKKSSPEISDILKNNNISVIEEEFICPGGFLFFGGHPNKKDIESAISFAKKIYSK